MKISQTRLRNRMRRETERFLSRALGSLLDPRAEYERLLRDMQRPACHPRPRRRDRPVGATLR